MLLFLLHKGINGLFGTRPRGKSIVELSELPNFESEFTVCRLRLIMYLLLRLLSGLS